MKILVVSLAGIGDTLIATPLIRELRAIYPTAVIDVFVMWAGSRDTLEGNPYVNTVYFKNLLKSSKPEVMKFLWQLRRNQYDASINAHPQAKSEYRLVARVIGARKRISHNYHHSEWFSQLLGDHTIPQDYEKHSVENTLDLLRFLDVKPVLPTHQYDLFLSPSELAWADAFFAEHKLAGRRRFAIHVGSGGTKNLALRRWPLENYIALIQRLNRTHPELAILLFGGPEEEKDHARILAQTSREQVIEVKSQNFRQSAAVLRACDMVITCDTSIMHLGAAMQVPKQFVIETPTFYKPNHPYNNPFVMIPNPGVGGRNLEHYLYNGRPIRGTNEEIKALMASITVDSVYNALIAACPFLQNGK